MGRDHASKLCVKIFSQDHILNTCIKSMLQNLLTRSHFMIMYLLAISTESDVFNVVFVVTFIVTFAVVQTMKIPGDGGVQAPD